MRAIVCTELGGPDKLQLQTLPERQPGPTEVRIRVAAAGVNFPDTLIIQGKYQLRAEPPFIPGAEVAGEVIEVGAKVTHLKPHWFRWEAMPARRLRQPTPACPCRRTCRWRKRPVSRWPTVR